MIHGIIFDVDGVLLNSMSVWENLGERYLRRMGISAETGLGEILFSMSMEEGAGYLISHYRLPMTCEQVVKGLAEEVEEFYAQRVSLKEGVRRFLYEFYEKKIPMVIATSGDRKNAEAALKRLKVFSCFQRIFTCTEIGSGKNQPEIYLTAALHMGTSPENTLVFEDSYYAICTAKRAGFRTAAVYDPANGGNLAQIKRTADIYLQDFSDFDLFWKQTESLKF